MHVKIVDWSFHVIIIVDQVKIHTTLFNVTKPITVYLFGRKTVYFPTI